MADDPTRYLDVSGVLALKAGATVDVDYTVTHARSVAARDRELGALADAAMAEARRTRWTATRDHTLIFAVEAVSDLAVNPERNTLTFKTGA